MRKDIFQELIILALKYYSFIELAELLKTSRPTIISWSTGNLPHELIKRNVIATIMTQFLLDINKLSRIDDSKQE